MSRTMKLLMPYDNRDIQSVIQAGESERVEFKKIFDKEAIETLVAFANHKGGVVLVGVEDSGRVAGVMCGPETIQGWVNQVKQSTAILAAFP